MQVSRDNIMNLSVDEVVVPDGRRDVNRETVKRIAASINQIGLQHPITVRSRGDRFILVAGRHRLEAARSLSMENIRAAVVKCDDTDARLWEIAENLHRSELSVQERSDQIAEWVKLTDEKVSRQVDAKPQGGRPEGGIRAASREIGITEQASRRAIKIAAISPEAKEIAEAGGLADNQSALLEIAKASPDQQAAKASELAARKVRKPIGPSDPPRNDFEVVNKEHRALVRAWENARSEARERFLAEIGATVDDPPIMDRRFA